MAYRLIAHQELASTQASITFSSIPTTFTDLLLVVSGRSSVNDLALDCFISFNGSTSNFSARQLYGYGPTVASNATARQAGGFPGGTSTGSIFSNLQIYIPNYRSSLAKTYSVDSTSENNATTSFNNIVAGLWNDTSPITSVGVSSGAGGSLLQFSSATLYGITAGSNGVVVS